MTNIHESGLGAAAGGVGYETKAAGPGSNPAATFAAPGGGTLPEALDELHRSFAAYRDTNEERLAELERRDAVDPLLSEKLARMDRALDLQQRRIDELALQQVRPRKGEEKGTGFRSGAAIEHKAAFESYMRCGREEGLRPLEVKALSAGSDPDGGYLVPEETEAGILRRLAQVSPIRAIAGARSVSASVFKKPYSLSGPATGWVAETAARPETAAPTLAELAFPTMELYAMPAATATLLEDAAVDVDEWLAGEVETAFAEQEGAAFVAGDGLNKPRGFLDYTRVDESAWQWGRIGTVKTGVAGGFAASDPADVLIDLIYALKAGYRQNGRFVMNRKTQGALRKLKDGDGNYLWQPPATAGAPATLMAFPVTEAEDMPDIGADAAAIAFGDFKRGYLVVDRTGVRILRDPYSSKPYVLFYTTKRVGGGVQDFDAIKLLVFSA